jgi:hypothetical protein
MPFQSTTALAFRLHVAGNNKSYLRLHLKCPIVLPYFNETWSFSTGFSLRSSIKFHGNLFTGGAALIHAYGRTDITTLIGASRDYAKVPRIEQYTNWTEVKLPLSSHINSIEIWDVQYADVGRCYLFIMRLLWHSCLKRMD